MRELNKWEIDNLIDLIDETNNFESDLTTEDLAATNNFIRRNPKVYFSSHIIFFPKISPRSFYINLKIGKNSPKIIIRKLLDCLEPPFELNCDFFAITESSTRQEPSLLHPSVATSFNETKMINDLNDEAELLNEFDSEDLQRAVLDKHHVIRRYFF